MLVAKKYQGLLDPSIIMSAAGIQAKHLRTMAALEEVVKENAKMKAEIARLKAGEESMEKHAESEKQVRAWAPW